MLFLVAIRLCLLVSQLEIPYDLIGQQSENRTQGKMLETAKQCQRRTIQTQKVIERLQRPKKMFLFLEQKRRLEK